MKIPLVRILASLQTYEGILKLYHAAPTTDKPMHKPMPKSAQTYGETSSRNCPTYPIHQCLFRLDTAVLKRTLKASPSPVKSISGSCQFNASSQHSLQLTSSNHCQRSGSTTESIFETHFVDTIERRELSRI
jgi:hypothetical protein